MDGAFLHSLSSICRHIHQSRLVPASASDAVDVSSEPDAIASIVDSVLAELKPKLVEEIARKMNSEKEKKGKGKKNKK